MTTVEPNPAALNFTLTQTALGVMTQTICDTTDAAPAAVLVHLAGVIGTAVGRGPYTEMLGEEHANIYALVVGKTGYGRKGTSWAPVRRASYTALPEWAENGITSGLSSGEGLIAHFSAKDEAEVPGTPQGPPLPPQPETPPTPTLLVETEFASVLKRGDRQGSTLTELLRQMWEDHRAGTMTRTDPLKVSGVHVSVIGHVTPADLHALASRESISNGTLNRFLAVYSQRSGPTRTRVDRAAVRGAQDQIVPLLRAAVAHGQKLGYVQFAPDAERLWDRLIPMYDREPVTVTDELGQRAASYLARLALIFAIADEAVRVDANHLRAAAEVWDYSVASWKMIYGDRTGDQLADRLLEQLREAGLSGLTRADLRQGLSNGQKARLDEVRDRLATAGFLHWTREPPGPGGGRPVERWTATTETTETTGTSESERVSVVPVVSVAATEGRVAS
jgi:hypothetical protein